MRSADQPIELKIERRQVALVGVAVLVLFGAIFSLGVLVGRQIASSSLQAPQQPPPGDLAALDAANRAPKPPKVISPPPEEPKAGPAKAEQEKPDASAEPEKSTGVPPGNEPADDDEAPVKPGARAPVVKVVPQEPPKKPEPKAEKKPAPKAEKKPEPKAEKKPEPKAEKKPEPKPEPPEPPEPKKRPVVISRYTVQLGASPDQKVAQKIQAKARAAGFEVHVLEVDLGAKGTWYRVRLGSYGSKEEAAKVQKDAERLLRVPAMVMPAQ